MTTQSFYIRPYAEVLEASMDTGILATSVTGSVGAPRVSEDDPLTIIM